MDILTIVLQIFWIIVQVAIWLGIIWLLVPKIFKYIIAPNFDGSYNPKKDPVPKGFSSKTQNLPQNNDPVVEINEDTGIYAIKFGEYRTFDLGLVECYYNGQYYSSKPSESSESASKNETKRNFKPLHFTGLSKKSSQDFRGSVEEYIMRWSVDGENPILETSIIKSSKTCSLVFKTCFLDNIKGWSAKEKKNKKDKRPLCSFPCFQNNSRNLRIFTYRDMIFSPPLREFESVFAPVLFFDDSFNTVMLSSLNYFSHATTYRTQNQDGVFRYFFGLQNELNEIPKGTELSGIMMFGSGIFDSFMDWGDMLRKYYNKSVDKKFIDVVNEKLGYFTDNGGYYYYNPLKGKDYSQTLTAVHEHALSIGIPLCYYNLDSWWYQKSVQKWKRTLLGGFGRIIGGGLYGGTLLWEPDPQALDISPKELGENLNVVFTAHNRWVANKSPYVQKYRSVVDGNKALPLEKGYWDEIMDYAKENRIECYEQDWMTNHIRSIAYLRENLDAPDEWLNQMAEAASERGISIMYCMANPAQWMQSVKYDNVVVTRASGDYNPRWPRAYDTPSFTQASLFAHALGLKPFKDVFMSTSTGPINGERQPELMALISVLSCGPVGLGDAIGAMDKTLAMATARKDGTLIKPHQPLIPVDLMFTRHSKYYILSTFSDQPQLGLSWYYLLAINLWPSRVKEKWFTMQEIGLTANPNKRHIAYDFFDRSVEIIENNESKLSQKLGNEKYKYRIIAPDLGLGFYFIGDVTKFASISSLIIKSIAVDTNSKSLNITLNGLEGDLSELLFYIPPKQDGSQRSKAKSKKKVAETADSPKELSLKTVLHNPGDADLAIESLSDGLTKVTVYYKSNEPVQIAVQLATQL